MKKLFYTTCMILTLPFKLLNNLVQILNNNNIEPIIFTGWSIIGVLVFFAGHCYENIFIALLGGIIIGFCTICCFLITGFIIDIITILSDLFFQPLSILHDRCSSYEYHDSDKEEKERERKEISKFIIK